MPKNICIAFLHAVKLFLILSMIYQGELHRCVLLILKTIRIINIGWYLNFTCKCKNNLQSSYTTQFQLKIRLDHKHMTRCALLNLFLESWILVLKIVWHDNAHVTKWHNFKSMWFLNGISWLTFHWTLTVTNVEIVSNLDYFLYDKYMYDAFYDINVILKYNSWFIQCIH